MKNILSQKKIESFIFFFFIISLGLSAQINSSSRICLHSTIDSTLVSFKNDKMLKDHSKLKKQYICLFDQNKTTITSSDFVSELYNLENSVANKLISAVNIDGVSYFKSGGNTYYAIDLEADSPTVRFRRWSRRNKGNIG